MSAFGWSLPAGVTQRQIDAAFGRPDEMCCVCGHDIDDCICPTCSVCGTQGDPKCYEAHGLSRSLAQITGRAVAEQVQDAMNKAHEAGIAEIMADEKAVVASETAERDRLFARFRVEPFMVGITGEVSGFRVVSGVGASARVHGSYFASVHKPGSIKDAWNQADVLCDLLQRKADFDRRKAEEGPAEPPTEAI